MIHNILLDLDDTILDFHMAEKVALDKAFAEIGIPLNEEIKQKYSEINKRQWKRLELGEITRDQVRFCRFDFLFDEIGFRYDGKEAAMIYEKWLGQGHYFVEGAEALLERLHGDYRLYLASNGTTSVQKGRIASAGISKYFEAMVISQEIGVNKPSKEFFEHCFSLIPDFKPEETIMIGDSLSSDIQGGINAGIQTIWFNPKGSVNHSNCKPAYEIGSLSEIYDILQK